MIWLMRLDEVGWMVTWMDWIWVFASSTSIHLHPPNSQTPQLETDIESQTHQTESSRERESQTPGPNGRTKLKRPSYQWDYATEHAMLQSLSETKNSGLQTHTTFKDKAWLDCQVAVDAAQTDPRAPPIDMTRLSSKWQTFKNWWSDYCRHYGVGRNRKIPLFWLAAKWNHCQRTDR
jgi:hypothetical protein